MLKSSLGKELREKMMLFVGLASGASIISTFFRIRNYSRIAGLVDTILEGDALAEVSRFAYHLGVEMDWGLQGFSISDFATWDIMMPRILRHFTISFIGTLIGALLVTVIIHFVARFLHDKEGHDEEVTREE